MKGLILLALLVFANTAVADIHGDKIRRHSFLVEEAYNVEAGTVQHAIDWNYNRHSNYLVRLTQKWSIVNEEHQLSYSLPFNHTGSPTRSGLGDINVDYRYQLVNKENIALAPRFTVYVPTGKWEYDWGRSAVGYEIGIPLSVELGEKWVTHWNVGMNLTPRAKSTLGTNVDAFSTFYGASIIWAAFPKFNFLTELAGTSQEVADAKANKGRRDTLYVNPGFRGAFDLLGVRWVAGGSVQVGVGPSERELAGNIKLTAEHLY